MKKILLSAGMLFLALAAHAQDCTAVTTLNEDFSDFTIGTAATIFPQHCWSVIAGSFQTGGPVIYTAQSGEPANQFVTFYASTAANTNAYLVSPEISNFDGNHELSFTTYKATAMGSVAPGTATIQIGTISNVADATTFTALAGATFTVSTGTPETHDNIIIPSAPAGSHIAFRILGDTQHNAIAIDNVVWSEVPVETPVCEAVATFNEDFNAFTVATPPVAVNQNCWTSSTGGGLLYMSADAGDNYVTFYTSGVAGNSAYLVTPELTTIDGLHELSFDTGLVTPTSGITIQLGTLASATDYTTFVPFGDAITTTFAGTTVSGIVFPASATQKFIAIKLTGAGAHDAAFIDNAEWKSTTAGLTDLAKGSFSMFPNPASGKNVTLTFDAESAANLVNVYTLTGAKVFETNVTSTSQNLNLSALASGMYIVKVEAGNASVSKKLVIQ
jgi:hypothetical protein